MYGCLLQGETLYKVRWLNYSPSWDTWEPYGNLESCHEMMKAYSDKHKKLLAKQKVTRTADIIPVMKYIVHSSKNQLLVQYYSSTCHGRPPLVQRKSGPSWQVAPRDRERTYAPLCQIKHTHHSIFHSTCTTL